MTLQQGEDNSESLESLFLSFASTVLEKLTSWAKLEGMPSHAFTYIEFTKDSWSEIPQVKADPISLLYSHYNSLLEMKESEDCVRRHWEAGILQSPNATDSEGNPVSLTFEQSKFYLVQELLFPIIEVLNNLDSTIPLGEQLINSYHSSLKLWTSKKLSRNAILPILNLISDIQQGQLIGKYFQLAPFPPEEKSVFWNNWGLSSSLMASPIDLMTFNRIHYKFAGTFFQKRDGSYEENADFDSELRDIITALRLFKVGDVGAPTRFIRGKTLVGVSEYTESSSPNDLRTRRFGLTYELDEQELPAIRELFNSLQSLNLQKQRKGLAVALRHFNQAYGRDTEEDQVIDFVIALESTLLADIDDELRFKFTLRGAALLAEIREPSKTRLILDTMYKVRSQIVHNGHQLPDLQKFIQKVPEELRPHGFAKCCEEIVRDVLRIYVNRLATSRQSIAIINANLENQVFNSITPKAMRSRVSRKKLITTETTSLGGA